MKSYEQMASDVLRRRDTELKKRKRAFLIGAPCAAAVLVAVTAVGVGAAVSSNRHGKYIHLAIDKEIGSNEVAVSMVSAADPFPIDYTNPNVGQTKIVWLSAEKPSAGGDIELDEKDFTEYTLERLDSYYRLRFNRLGEVYTDWKLSYDKLGDYRREIEMPGAVGMVTYYTRNTLNYVTESGAKVTVSAQREKFDPVSDETFTADKPITRPDREIKYEYDKDGNVIGETIVGYTGHAPDPAASVGHAPTPAPDEGVSTVNGYEALIYRLSDGSFLADLDMNSRVRITAEGISDEKFLEILDNFTK